jgi:hypothetical protein
MVLHGMAYYSTALAGSLWLQVADRKIPSLESVLDFSSVYCRVSRFRLFPLQVLSLATLRVKSLEPEP